MASIGFELGYDPVEVVRVVVGTARRPGGGSARGPLRGSRRGRPRPSDAVVLLGHTLDDQAETVLLGLGRGSGPRAMAGMRPVDGRYRRPFLGVRRATTRGGVRGSRPHAVARPGTTATRASSACGCDPRCCRCSSRSCRAGWRKPWPVPQPSRGPISTRSTRSPSPICPPRAAPLDVTRLAAQPRRSAPECCGAGRRARGVPALTATHLAELDALVARLARPGRTSICPAGSA